MSNGTLAIQVNGISKTYGDFQAVKNLSFEVEQGEIFAILGPNGAGKSSTIRMILDIIKPDQGSIAVLGGALSESMKNRIGYLPEERGLYKTAQVLEMMSYLGRLKGMSASDAKESALKLLERVDLAHVAKKRVEELSKGMQQKVQFAVTILHRPELIIIDEPFSGLDPVNRLLLKDLLDDFQKQGGTIIMSTHQMNQVEEMARRMLMINRGEAKLYGEVSKIRREFAKHAIIVEGTGDWAKLNGVTSVEAVPTRRGATLLNLAPTATPDALLSAIAQSNAYQIERFELAIPSLDDVFIRVAGEGVNV